MAAVYFFAFGLSARLGKPELAYVIIPIIFVLTGSLTGFVVSARQPWRSPEEVCHLV